MIEGVVVLNSDQQVLFLNQTSIDLLHLPREKTIGKPLWKLTRHRQLLNAVERILSEDQPFQGELEWLVPEQKVLSLHGTQLPGAPLRGAVLVLNDITHVRQLERLRQEFVANVSHELKTPLATIQATVETLLNGAIRDPDHNVRFLQRVQENTERLHRLVLDLLSLGRLESGQEIMEPEILPLQVFLEDCLARQEDRAKAKGLTIEYVPPEAPVLALADPEALAHILDNLVDNSIKYTPGGGRITLSCFTSDTEAGFSVTDTGVGIPEKDLPRIFERFYRVDKARSRELGGTGLGLSIVKHLVQALSGRITATSTLGVGSSFTIHLPRNGHSEPATD
jgi:two-component system phosphate regulon sensor histidine kinase PhoR